jgi:hypothetical protein
MVLQIFFFLHGHVFRTYLKVVHNVSNFFMASLML